jgi:Glycosyltransferase sugar-binding region containing DXD motif
MVSPLKLAEDASSVTTTTTTTTTTRPPKLASVAWHGIKLLVLLLHGMYLTQDYVHKTVRISTTTATTATVAAHHHHHHHHRVGNYIPLSELVVGMVQPTSSPRPLTLVCPKSTVPLHIDDYDDDSRVLESIPYPHNDATNHHHGDSTKTLPRILHLMSKSPCVTSDIHNNIHQWYNRLQPFGYSIVFHDEAAVDRLLYGKTWPEFPHLQLFLRNCGVLTGTTTTTVIKTKVWKYLVLWEYGGVYTDLDTVPGEWLWNGTTTIPSSSSSSTLGWLDPTTSSIVDAWLLPTRDTGHAAPYFMVARPKHPLFYFAVLQTLFLLGEVKHGVPSQNDNVVASVTGMRILQSALQHFRQLQNRDWYKPDHYDPTLSPGIYVGMNNRSVTVDATPATTEYYVRHNRTTTSSRSEQEEEKGRAALLGDVSCLERLHSHAWQQQQQQQQPHTWNHNQSNLVVPTTPTRSYYVPPPK